MTVDVIEVEGESTVVTDGDGSSVVFVESDAQYIVESEETFVVLDVASQGPVGAQGIQGPQGIQGIQGIQGVQGPQGVAGPATIILRRHDNAGGYDYCGKAASGTADSTAAWTITRILVASDGTTTRTTATNVAWTNRLTATYT